MRNSITVLLPNRPGALRASGALVILAFAGLRLAAAWQESPPTESRRFVLMRSGQLLDGEARRVGDRFVITSPNGGESRVPARDVHAIIASIEEAYKHRKKQADPTSATQLIELAEWCIKYDLLREAHDELRAAAALDTDNPRLPLAERKLALRVKTTTAPAQATSHQVEMNAGKMSERQLQYLVRALPKGTVEEFSSQIQPILLNYCSTGACHGAQSTSQWKLLRTQLGRGTSRRITERNLVATLDLIDREKPHASLLLTMATQQHGTTKGAVLGDDDLKRFAPLKRWVLKIAKAEAPATDQRTPQESPGTTFQDGQVQPASASEPLDEAELEAEVLRLLDEAEEKQRRGAKSGSQKDDDGEITRWPTDESPVWPELDEESDEVEDKDWAPKDPFDPEIFNRRYFPKPPKSTEDE